MEGRNMSLGAGDSERGKFRRVILGHVYNNRVNQSRYTKLYNMHHPPSQNKNTNTPINTVKFTIRDDPFIVPVKFKREVPLNKNIFELEEAEPKNYQQREEKVETEMTMLDPLQMSIATTKFLLLDKIISYVSAFSIALSIYQVYYVQQDQLLQYLDIFHSALTLLLILCATASAYYQIQNSRSRRVADTYFFPKITIKCLVILIAPNLFFEFERLLFHLGLLLRTYFPLAYSIRASLFYSPRAARIIHLYGIKPQVTFQFAWKVILNEMGIFEVLYVYVAVVLFYSHCLFLTSEDRTFIDCLQVIIVTLPTIGYGDYTNTKPFSRIIILLVLLSGVSLNAFVTLTLLKKFEMSSNESNSYQLMQKLNMNERIQELSSQFIIRKFRKGERDHLQRLIQRQKDEKFKEQYKECKAKYQKISQQDSAYQFNSFKDSLLSLKVKINQVSNMLNVLIAKLTSELQHRKPITKQIPKM